MIETPKDWWDLLDKNWGNLISIFSRFLPVNEYINLEKEITSGRVSVLIERAKQDRDENTLLSYLNEAWWLAPDNPRIHSIPSWGVLCDLCSECWVFDKEL